MIYEPCLQLMGSWRAERILVSILMLYKVLGSSAFLRRAQADGHLAAGLRMRRGIPARTEVTTGTRAHHRLRQWFRTGPLLLASPGPSCWKAVVIRTCGKFQSFVLSSVKGHEISAAARGEKLCACKGGESIPTHLLTLELIMLCISFPVALSLFPRCNYLVSSDTAVSFWPDRASITRALANAIPLFRASQFFFP